jgi:Asp-tRNA(Asn)/Glu-tRNA(Gln) amidotransferase A subunit family amidase
MPGVLISVLLLAPTLVAGLDWKYEDESYWAKEIARYPKNETVFPTTAEGVSYFSVGSVEWPQFQTTDEDLSVSLPPGAYIAAELGENFVVSEVYQIKSDSSAQAFMHGAYPVNGGSFEAFDSAAIPVPPAVGNGPLGGLRFAVKDIFHIKGLKTSGGSRSYYNTYGPQNYTTEVVEKSIVAGARMVGKTKTIAFALGTPRNGWEVDYQDPWNLRGDGYQTTGGSSSGSSSAITAYEWLDFTIGSDTGGSVRFPARFAGFYGYKPTHGIYNLTGILVAIAEQDTPGHMARSPAVFTQVYDVWSNNTPLANAPTTLPSQLQFWSDEAPLTQPAAEAMKQNFFSNVTTALNLTTFSRNLTASHIEVFGTGNYSEYYNTVYADQNSVQFYDEIGADLVETFGALNDGAFPPSDPVVNLTFADGVNETTRARYPESQAKRAAYAEWFNTEILPASNDSAVCTDYIVAHSLHVPPSTVKYNQTPFTLVRGFYNGLQASFAGTPEIVVPIGQITYFSPFTLKEEYQTVTVAFQAPRGCDGTLMELVRVLTEQGLLKEVMPGKTAYEAGVTEAW